MLANELIIDAFERINQIVHKTVEGLSIDDITFRPTDSANSIAWLVWHLTRIQDDHIAGIRKENQVWIEGGWSDKFALEFEEMETGYGQTSDDVAKVKVNPKLILGYYDAVSDVTKTYINGLTEKDYMKIVDKRWNPPVTLAVRLISIISDDLQHAGQAAYVRGMINKHQ